MAQQRLFATFASRSTTLLLAALALALAGPAAGATLQVDPPWNFTGANTGSVGAVRVTASAAPRWGAAFGDQSTFYSSSVFGALALPPGNVGDFFRADLGTGTSAGLTTTITVTFLDPVTDPIFYLIDLNAVGATVTVSPGGTLFTTTATASWAGNVLAMTSGTRADAAVQYHGVIPGGSAFTFAIDYTGTSGISVDFVGLGIATPVPEPEVLALLAAATATAAAAARRSRTFFERRAMRS